jgi:hypothetical protein
MAMRVLVVHDTRSVGFLAAAVIARVRVRQGEEVAAYFGREATRDVGAFWASAADRLPLAGVDHVVLSSVTFDRRQPEVCRAVLDHIAATVGSRAEIWSHRWPDGYRDRDEVYVPPFELVERYRMELGPPELRLLRLSLIMSRQVPRHRIDAEDQRLADRLDLRLWDDPEGAWKALRQAPEALLAELDRLGAAPVARPDWGRVVGVDDAVVDVDLAGGARGFEEKAVEQLLADADVAEHAVAVAPVHDQDGSRLYLCRRGGLLDRPSLRHLVATDGPRLGLPAASHWFGPPDALHLPLEDAEGGEAAGPALQRRVAEFAAHAARATTGEREPDAAVTKLVWRAAVQALQNLDLLGRYTADMPEGGPALQVRPEEIRKLLAVGNRGNELRHTLIVTVTAHTADAAAFLFLDGGYNLLKLERLLEGVLLGLRSLPSGWLELVEPPSRLRVDVSCPPEVARALPHVMRRTPKVAATDLAEATQAGAVAPESNVAEALRRFDTDRLIVRGQSETIGPSVPYALLLATTASEVATAAGRCARVQDLFAGSGLASLVVHHRQPGEPTIHAVDDSVSRREAVAADDASGLLWLRTDVCHVLGGEHAILEERYDVTGMDPPHAALFDLVFDTAGETDTSLLGRAAASCDWLVIYQGHVTQRGRADLLTPHLGACFARAACWQIGQELLLLCGPDQVDYDRVSLGWDELLTALTHRLEAECAPYRWPVRVGELQL